MKIRKKIQYVCLMAVCLFGVFSSQAIASEHCTEESSSCSYAIFPHTNFKQLLMVYSSLLEDLSLILDVNVKLVSSRTLADFAANIDRRAYDIVFVGPGLFITHARLAGYVPLARFDGELEMKMFVRSDSDIYSYADLKDKKVGFMLKNTTSWFSTEILMQRYNLSKEDVDLVPQGSQQSCAHAIAIRQVDACMFSVTNLNVIKEQYVNVEFRGVGEGFKLVNPVYAVHPNMPHEVKTLIKEYFISRDGYTEAKLSDFSQFRHDIDTLN